MDTSANILPDPLLFHLRSLFYHPSTLAVSAVHSKLHTAYQHSNLHNASVAQKIEVIDCNKVAEVSPQWNARGECKA